MSGYTLPEGKKALSKIKCNVCDKEFQPYRKSQRYCSQRCKNHFHYQKRADQAKSWQNYQRKFAQG